MASELKLQVPDGQFCMDNHHLDCPYKQVSKGHHWCPLFDRDLDKVEIQDENRERRRLIYKCPECLEAAQQTTETSDEIIVHRVLYPGWMFP